MHQRLAVVHEHLERLVERPAPEPGGAGEPAGRLLGRLESGRDAADLPLRRRLALHPPVPHGAALLFRRPLHVPGHPLSLREDRVPVPGHAGNAPRRGHHRHPERDAQRRLDGGAQRTLHAQQPGHRVPHHPGLDARVAVHRHRAGERQPGPAGHLRHARPLRRPLRGRDPDCEQRSRRSSCRRECGAHRCRHTRHRRFADEPRLRHALREPEPGLAADGGERRLGRADGERGVLHARELRARRGHLPHRARGPGLGEPHRALRAQRRVHSLRRGSGAGFERSRRGHVSCGADRRGAHSARGLRGPDVAARGHRHHPGAHGDHEDEDAAPLQHGRQQSRLERPGAEPAARRRSTSRPPPRRARISPARPAWRRSPRADPTPRATAGPTATTPPRRRPSNGWTSRA